MDFGRIFFSVLFFLSTSAAAQNIEPTTATGNIITDSDIKYNIECSLNETIGLLLSLKESDEFGDVGWFSSLTITSAVDKLRNSIDKLSTVTHSGVRKYKERITLYFNDYIVEDLNIAGVKRYRDITANNDKIINSLNLTSDPAIMDSTAEL